ncbi:MAG: hypothetical protein LBK06_09845, partial [Planctomycetaceae bacterium]|nr:hypothetical protein [Planctomycetaceae bacterium]
MKKINGFLIFPLQSQSGQIWRVSCFLILCHTLFSRTIQSYAQAILTIQEAEYIPKNQKVIVNGRTFEGEMYVIRKMTLKEVSFVDLGADSNTTAVVELQYIDNEPVSMNEQNIFETKTNTDCKQPMKVEASAINTEKIMKEFQSKMLLDQRRMAAIEKIGGGRYPELEAKAMEEGWAVEKFHIEYQQRSMPCASRVAMPKESQANGLNPTTLEAIALATSGCSMQFLETQYEDKSLALVDKFRGIGIQEFCELACEGKYLPKYRR